MASITHNLFWGQGETTHQLNVESGAWPTDMDGFVFIVGPEGDLERRAVSVALGTGDMAEVTAGSTHSQALAMVVQAGSVHGTIAVWAIESGQYRRPAAG